MTIDDLTVIGERINPGFKSTKALFDAGDIAGIQALALRQAEAGADYLNVNVGSHAEADPHFLREVIAAVQAVTDLPLSFDSPRPAVQEVCLATYDEARARGRKPIVNSITECRWEMMELLAIRRFKVVVMASERMEDGAMRPNKEAGQFHDALVDVSISTLASDTEGLTAAALEGIRRIRRDPELAGIHLTGGLSNIAIQLPARAVDGSNLREQVENAFLTLAVPHGLDTVLGTPWREYRLLADDDPILREFKQIIALKGLDALRRVRRLYKA
jgi:cobalamin-dependent methionine synthase I